MSFKCWAPNRGRAIDVAVICPMAHVRDAEPCESYATLHKHARYDAAFKVSNYDFMVFETSGAVNGEGLDILRQIFRCASKRSGMGHSGLGPPVLLPTDLCSANDFK